MLQKKIKLVLILSLLFTFASACSSVSKEKKQEKEFRVGMTVGYPPFNWIQNSNKDGAVQLKGAVGYAGGYDIDMAKKIAKGLNKKLVIIKTEWDGLVPALTSGKIDAIIAGMSPTKERLEVINFTKSYYDAELVMVTLKDSPYAEATSIQDFSNARVTGQLNTFHYKALDQIKGLKKEVPVDSSSSMRVALQSKVIDAYISDLPEGLSSELITPNFKLVELKDGFNTSVEDTVIAIGLNKKNKERDKINDILASISQKERDHIMREAIKRQPGLASPR